MKNEAFVLKVSEEVVELNFPVSLTTAQSFVGGYVEMVHIFYGREQAQMLVNEDGIMKGDKINHRASVLAGKPIVGDVVVLRGQARWK